MKTKKLLALLLAGAMSASLLAGCGSDSSADTTSGDDAANPSDTAAADSDLAQIEDAGKLKIGYTVYEPMNYTDEQTGEFTGFDTEFAQAVCEKLGVEPEFIEIVWDTKQVSLESGEVDCLWNGMTITEDLKQNISVSDPYCTEYPGGRHQDRKQGYLRGLRQSGRQDGGGRGRLGRTKRGRGGREPQPVQPGHGQQADRRAARGQVGYGGRRNF